MREHEVYMAFHYLSLHLSDYYKSVEANIPQLPNCDRYADCLVRLPMYFELQDSDVYTVINLIKDFYHV